MPVSCLLTSKSAYLSFPFHKMRGMEIGGLASPTTVLYTETSLLDSVVILCGHIQEACYPIILNMCIFFGILCCMNGSTKELYL